MRKIVLYLVSAICIFFPLGCTLLGENASARQDVYVETKIDDEGGKPQCVGIDPADSGASASTK